ncbi:uncharacterized protein F5147DRAFT_777687 [Suillus discolor]|uniref:Uncharacterized protein n=1 Tax=Suillus discolor TaxID=1912936 RepID=A0A9P7JQL8_9AGAM|nr:uncharacterized protein F5147DRAFT_777687 [Suillus discolor]KAG2098445.1 hypothetical protein F5147DRAFT_777687 [Suillus discolor]
MDREDRRDPEMTILTTLLLNPLFCLEGWYFRHVGKLRGYSSDKIWRLRTKPPGPSIGEVLGPRAAVILQANGPYKKDLVYYSHPERFECLRLHDSSYEVRDYAKAFRVPIPVHLLLREMFEVARWFKSRLTRAYGKLCDEIMRNAPEYDILRLLERGPMTPAESQIDEVARRIYTPPPDAKIMCKDTHLFVVELNGQQIPAGTYPAIHRTAAVAKDFKRVIPKPLVVTIHINGQLA